MSTQYYDYHNGQSRPVRHVREIPHFRKVMAHARIEGANTRKLASQYHRLIKRLAEYVGRKGYRVCIYHIIPDRLHFHPDVQLWIMKGKHIYFELWTNGHWFFYKDSPDSHCSISLGRRVDVAVKRLLKYRLAEKRKHAQKMAEYLQELPEKWRKLAENLRPTCLRLTPKPNGKVLITDIFHDVGGYMVNEYSEEEITAEKLQQLQQGHDETYHRNSVDPYLDFLGVPSIG